MSAFGKGDFVLTHGEIFGACKWLSELGVQRGAQLPLVGFGAKPRPKNR